MARLGSDLSKQEKAFLQEMVKPEEQAWLTCEKILTSIYVEMPELRPSFQDQIKLELSGVKSLMVLLLIHSKKIKPSSPSYYLSNPYENAYKQMLRKSKCFDLVNEHLDKLQTSASESLQTALELLLEELPNIYTKELRLGVKPSELKFLIYQATRYQITREREVNTFINFLGKLQQIELQDARFENNQKGIQIVKILVQILVADTSKRFAGNLALILDEPFLKTQKILQNFIHLNSEYLLALDQFQLQQLFINLTKRSINYYSISFFYRISQMLVQEEEFFKIRHLYENFVLSQLIRRAKCCKHKNIQDIVLSVSEYYVIGMWSHCLLGSIGLQCLLENIDIVDSPISQERWLALSHIVALKEQSQEVSNYFAKWLSQKKLKVNTDRAETLMKTNHTWQITSRSIKKHKKYKTYDSDLTGLVNQGNQCYIISIVQALFMTKKLKTLLEQVKRPKKYSLIYDLSQLFSKLAGYGSKFTLPTVADLKSDGPKEFALSQTQEDAQSYLIGLFEMLEKELKEEKLLDQFKAIFQIKSDQSIACKNCGYKAENQQLEYVHTIPHTENIALSYNEHIIDYECPKCKQLQIYKQTRLTINSSILIVHINRFSVTKGEARKELPTTKIKRNIQGKYELVGMVFHIGKKMQLGHYIYYSRIDKKRWAEMNDQTIRQFQLDNEDQEFELEMKQQKTPYILFYKKRE